jgi:hypothetical protein
MCGFSTAAIAREADSETTARRRMKKECLATFAIARIDTSAN